MALATFTEELAEALGKSDVYIKRFNIGGTNNKGGLVYKKVAMIVPRGARVLLIEGYYPVNGELRAANYMIGNAGAVLFKDCEEGTSTLEDAILNEIRGGEDLESFRQKLESEGAIYEAKEDVLLVPVYSGVQQGIGILKHNQKNPPELSKEYKVMNILEDYWPSLDIALCENHRTAPRHL